MQALLKPTAGLAPIETPEPSDDLIQEMWERFQIDYQVNDSSRFDTFRDNVLAAHERNNEQGVNCTDLFDGEECVFGVTKFSHLTKDEFSSMMLGRRSIPNITGVSVLSRVADTSETQFDWRTKGAVTPVKNQNICGSCWAFSAVESVESAWFLATGELLELSTEQVVSCDPLDLGCSGGLPEYAYEYIMQAGGIEKAVDYPDTSSMTGVGGSCLFDASKTAAQISGWRYVVAPCETTACQAQDEDGLAPALVQYGPLSIDVHADDWAYYMGGIFNVACTSSYLGIDHAVLLVGYNKAETETTPYWIVRNSWDTDWGIEGYMYLAMGSNLCGIADYAKLPDV